jgi:hypothetical protein
VTQRSQGEYLLNLLIQSVPWDPDRGSVSRDRVFEHTEDPVAQQFLEGQTILFDRLIKHPCLFAQEGVNDELAHVGTIIRARLIDGEVAFDYVLDPAVPPIPNRTIFANRADFDITNRFEFSRTHWAVKDVDLYRVLLRLVRPRRQRPTVFTIGEHEQVQPELASVMMPFDAVFADVYTSIQEAANATGLRCRRADEIWEAPAIIQDVVSLIDRSRVVICDCTGRNANVFYEIGIAHTLGREVVLITQSPSDIPFDLRHLRYISYLNNGEGRKSLFKSLEARLRTVVERSAEA